MRAKRPPGARPTAGPRQPPPSTLLSSRCASCSATPFSPLPGPLDGHLPGQEPGLSSRCPAPGPGTGEAPGHRRAGKTRGRRRGFSRVEGWSERLGQGHALEPPGHGPGRRRERQPLAMAGGRGHGTGRGHEATGVGWEILAGFSIWFSCKAPRRASAMPSVLCASELLHRKPRLDLDGTTPR